MLDVKGLSMCIYLACLLPDQNKDHNYHHITLINNVDTWFPSSCGMSISALTLRSSVLVNEKFDLEISSFYLSSSKCSWEM